jgi:hypothetical protein
MTPRLTAAVCSGDYRLTVSFEDGTAREIDLEPELWGEMFEPLRDLETFRAFRVDRELSTIVWPNGADLAPEFLYGRRAADWCCGPRLGICV